MSVTIKRQRAAGVTLVVAAIAFFAGEAIAAAAWHEPAYSYGRNFISDLGVTTVTSFAGNPVNSPLAWVLNGAWILNGVLALVGLTILADARRTRIGASAYLFTVGYAIGLVTIAFFHEAPSWMFPFHLFGALIGIAGGNIAVILWGARSMQVGARRSGIVLVTLGTVGLVFTVVQSVIHIAYAGALERTAAYPVLVAQLFAGTVIAVRTARGTDGAAAGSAEGQGVVVGHGGNGERRHR